MSDSIYQQVLEAVESVLTPLTAVGQPLHDWTVTLRKEATFVQEQDRFPQVIVAPNRFLAVTPRRLLFARIAVLAYDVFVGDFAYVEWTLSKTYERARAKEAIRAALWSVNVAKLVPGGYDVDHQPEYWGGQAPPPNCDGSWNRYSYVVASQRATAG